MNPRLIPVPIPLILLATSCFLATAFPQSALAERIRKDDADGDGFVTRSEFKGPPPLFQRLDVNGDGRLSPDEIDAAGKQRSPGASNTGGSGDPFDQSKGAPPPRKISDSVVLTRAVVYGSGGGKPLLMDTLKPKEASKPLAAIVFIHGGGWQSGSREQPLLGQLMPYAEAGFFCASIDYRLTGEAIYPAQIEDCKAAIRHLRANAKAYGIDPDRMAVWGSSAGGHLAALVGTTADIAELEGSGGNPGVSSRVAAVVDWFGPTDLGLSYAGHLSPASPEGKLLGGDFPNDKDRIQRANPIAYASADDPPFLILHGDADTVVPPLMGQRLHDALLAKGVSSTYRLFPGEKHGGFRDPVAGQMTREFLAKVLLGK